MQMVWKAWILNPAKVMCVPIPYTGPVQTNNGIKRVNIETTGVCDVTMISRRYVFCNSHWSNLRFIGLSSQNPLIDHIGVYTDTNDDGIV